MVSPPRAMRFVLSLLLMHALPPCFTLEILEMTTASIADNVANRDSGYSAAQTAEMLQNATQQHGTLAESLLDNEDQQPVLLQQDEDESLLEMEGQPPSNSEAASSSVFGRCVMRGKCNQRDITNQPCAYDGRPLHVGEDALQTFAQWCPQMHSELGSNPALCCDEEALVDLHTSLTQAQALLVRCPSCMRNFANLWCQQACSPKQADFVKVVSTRPIEQERFANRSFANVALTSYVTDIRYSVSARYANGLYDSCKAVQFDAIQAPAINLMCGDVKGDTCTLEQWLGFMGSVEKNAMAPMNIDFDLTSSKPMNSSITPCDQPADYNSDACSCQDCKAACSVIVEFPDPHSQQCFIGGIMDCWVFVSLLAFVSLCVIILLMAGVHCFLSSWRSQSSEPSTPVKFSEHPFTVAKRGGLDIIVSSSNDDPGFWESLGAYVETRLENVCFAWGSLCTRHPFVVFVFGLAISLVCSSGLWMMKMTTDPVKLWSSENSQARLEKDFFDNNFNPFFRTAQIIVVPTDPAPYIHYDMDTMMEEPMGPVFDQEFLDNDVCFRPMHPDNNECAVLSVLQYFQNNATRLAYAPVDDYDMEMGIDYITHLKSCFESPTQTSTPSMHLSCLSSFGAPIQPYVVLGGIETNHDDHGESKITPYLDAKALVITVLLNNHVENEKNKDAQAWEKGFIEFLKEYKSDKLKINFMAERSIQDEIDRESKSDVSTIALSYGIMFAYIAVALGRGPGGQGIRMTLVRSKLLLGLCGVAIVLLSVTSSVGVYAFAGVPATLIIVEVVPFLVLAVGVDNIFIIVQTYQRDNKVSNRNAPLDERIGRLCGEVIPSMLISSLSECFCFFLAALSSMPAVKVFSLYAAMAIFFDFFLQVTCFLALFTFDVRREESDRMECCCCVRVKPSVGKLEEGEQQSVSSDGREDDGLIVRFIQKYYTPFLLSEPVRIAVLVLFSGWLFSSLAVVNKIQVGMDKKLSMPQDSYVLHYFEAVEDYLSVGPPVYFVVDGELDYGDREMQNLLCGSSGCEQHSLYGQVFMSTFFRNRSYIAHPVTSWMDDYFDWLRPSGDLSCCRVRDEEDEAQFCPITSNFTGCTPCTSSYKHGRPRTDAFYDNVQYFLSDNPSTSCAKGGHAAYSNAVAFSNEGKNISASYFMTYHTVLKTSNDFSNAIRSARFLANNISTTLNAKLTERGKPGVRVFPYSVFYVFYEQYLTIVQDAVIQLVLSLAAIFVVTTILLGIDPWSAAMIVLTIVTIVMNLFGLMFWWNIDFNAISLVNMVMAIGVSVEFCAHMVRANAISVEPTRRARAEHAVNLMGASVLSGITFTKFGGIVVLAFSHSQIFQIFYFRMYFGIVVFGAAHGLILLPVLLSFIGPPRSRHRLSRTQNRALSPDHHHLRHVRSYETQKCLLESESSMDVLGDSRRCLDRAESVEA